MKGVKNMLVKCIKDLICNGEIMNSFTCGNTYEMEEEDAGFFAINDMNQPHWLSDSKEDVEFINEHFRIIEFETETTFGGRLPKPEIKSLTTIKLTKEYTTCDCEYKQLVNEDGEILLSGDYYHDKIDSMINGYLKALKDNGIGLEFDTKEISCPECGE